MLQIKPYFRNGIIHLMKMLGKDFRIIRCFEFLEGKVRRVVRMTLVKEGKMKHQY